MPARGPVLCMALALLCHGYAPLSARSCVPGVTLPAAGKLRAHGQHSGSQRGLRGSADHGFHRGGGFVL